MKTEEEIIEECKNLLTEITEVKDNYMPTRLKLWAWQILHKFTALEPESKEQPPKFPEPRKEIKSSKELKKALKKIEDRVNNSESKEPISHG